MKVVITSEGSALEDSVDFRLGRCKTFLLTDTESDEARPVPNEAAALGGGAGIQAARKIVELGAEAVITGRPGPKAIQVLNAAGVKVYEVASGSARQALEAFKEGRLKEFSENPETGPGGGRGMGGARSGGAGGRGRGKGGGGGRGR